MHLVPKKLWYDAINEAEDLIKRDVSMQIQGYDIDGDMIKAARQNAEDAGVLDYIHFQQSGIGFFMQSAWSGSRLNLYLCIIRNCRLVFCLRLADAVCL